MIQMFHVYKQYQYDVPALEDINLTIQKGEFVFITGPTGAGKTTLLKLITCEEQASSGQIEVLGKKLNYLKKSSIPYLRRNIGCIFQDFRLLYQKTVYDNVALPLRIIGLSEGQVKSRVQEVLRSVGLAYRGEIYPIQLSRGEQQRVSIARALVNQPAILLADEPTGNLDERLGLEIFALLKEINTRGATIIVATHQQRIAETIQRRTICLEKGRITHDDAVIAV
jgi:cell division transport system ATP-binding protein